MEKLTKSNADAVKAKDDRRYETIPVEEWGVEVCIRSLTEPEYHEFRDATLTRAGKDRKVNEPIMRACLCAACIVDPETLQPIFTVDDLKGKSAHAISLIWNVAGKLCGMDDSEAEDILKNCETGRRAGSSSNSVLEPAAKQS